MIASCAEPARGRSSTCAIRYGRSSNFARPTTSVTGAETARRISDATGRRSAVATCGGSSFTGSETVSGRSSDASAWTIVRSAAARSSASPVRAATSTGVRRWRRSEASRCGRLTRRADPVELVLERGVVRLRGRRDVRAEEAHADPAEAANRRRPVGLVERARDRASPVDVDVELPCGQLPLATGGAEHDRPGSDRARAGFELLPRLDRRQPADGDARDLDAGGHARRRAGESQSEHADGEGDEPDGDGGPLPEQSARPSPRTRRYNPAGQVGQCIRGHGGRSRALRLVSACSDGSSRRRACARERAWRRS